MTWNWLYKQILKLKSVSKPTSYLLQVASHWTHTRESKCVKAQGTINFLCLDYDLGWDLTGLHGHGHVGHMADAEIFPNSPDNLEPFSPYRWCTQFPAFLTSLLQPAAFILTLLLTHLCCVSGIKQKWLLWLHTCQVRNISKCNKGEASDPW